MNNTEKLNKVKEVMPTLSKNKQLQIVRFLNWQTLNSEGLKCMFTSYKNDTGDKEINKIDFDNFIYQSDKQLPNAYMENISINN